MRIDQPGLELDRVAAEFYSDVRLAPFLGRLLTRSGELLGTVAGSISLVDSPSQRYTKMAERGASCRLGQTFPLDEGITGQVVARRRPVVLGRPYAVVATSALVVLLHGKARFEERHLAARFPGYDGYAARTPRLVPRLWTNHSL